MVKPHVVCSAGACIEALLSMLCSSTCASFRDLEATLDAVHMKVPPILGGLIAPLGPYLMRNRMSSARL